MPGRRILGWVAAAILLTASFSPTADAAHRESHPRGVATHPADCANLGQAANFAVFSDGDFTSISGTTVSGRIAAAGNVTLDGINAGPAAGESGPEITAGGNFTAGRSTGAGGTVNGGVSYGGTADVAPNFTVSGGLTHAAPPFSFDSEFVNLRELSASLAGQSQTAGATVSLNPYSAALQLTGTAAGLNVFTVSAAELTQAAGIVIDLTQPGATALINVTTDTQLTLAPQYMTLAGSATAAGILWNMSLATSLAISHGVSWQGSILAPNATVTTSSHPQLSGQLIAETVPSTDLVITEVKLTACLPPITPPTPPAPEDDTLSLTALCIDANGYLDMRLRNTGNSARAGSWIDLTGTDFGQFDVPAHSDLFFIVAGGSGASHIQATAGTTVVDASGTDKQCTGQLTIHLLTEGHAPPGLVWPVRVTGGANGNQTSVLNMAAGDLRTITVRGGYIPGIAPIDEVVGGMAYTISEDDTLGAQVTVSENPVEILDDQNEIVTVVNAYAAAGGGSGGQGGGGEPLQPEQPTLPPGAPDPPPGPDLDAQASGADLSITHHIAPQRLHVGGVVQSTTVVRNLGPQAAVGVVAREIPPARPHLYDQVSHVLALTTSSGHCTQARPVRCALGTLAPGASVTIRSHTRILVVANLRSVVEVSSDTADSNTANNMAEAGLSSVPDTTVRAAISAPSFVPFGTHFSYRASVTGTSSATAVNVRLCTRPPGSLLQVQSAGTLRVRGLYCRDIARLGRGQTVGFDVSATPSRSGRLIVSDRATVAEQPRVSHAVAPVLVGPTAACPATGGPRPASAGRAPVRSPPVARPAC